MIMCDFTLILPDVIDRKPNAVIDLMRHLMQLRPIGKGVCFVCVCFVCVCVCFVCVCVCVCVCVLCVCVCVGVCVSVCMYVHVCMHLNNDIYYA